MRACDKLTDIPEIAPDLKFGHYPVKYTPDFLETSWKSGSDYLLINQICDDCVDVA